MPDYRRFMSTNSPVTQQSKFETNGYWISDKLYKIEDIITGINVPQPSKQYDYEAKYKELLDKYNRLNNEYNQLMKEHLEVLNKCRLLTDKYTEFLEENNKQVIARTLDNEGKITIK
jgi:ABC-type Zn uptake system ZnuABC Zn-binding protein ZnuA